MHTFKDKAHLRTFIIGLLIVASENENLVLIQRSPAAATQQSELAFHIFDGWINLTPKVSKNIVQLNVIIVFSV